MMAASILSRIDATDKRLEQKATVTTLLIIKWAIIWLTLITRNEK